jgi:hypothetical protein
MDQDISVFVAPWALILGGGLIATAGLTFFNHHFYRTKLQAAFAFAGGVAILGMLEILFVSSSGAFFQRQKVVVSECELEGETAFPEQRAVRDSSDIRKAIVGCMSKAGYEWASDHYNCRKAPVAMNAYCYIPTALFNRAITNIQLKFE